MDISCPYAGERHIAGFVYVPVCRLPNEETPAGEIPGECIYTQVDCRYRHHLFAARRAAINQHREAARPPKIGPAIVPAWQPERKR